MTKEDIEKLLSSHESITLIMPDESSGGFDRDIKFIVRKIEYRIQWWINLCYLFIGEVQIPFHYIEISGTWPNLFKTNIQFSGLDGNKVAIIPAEEYP